MTTRTEPKHEPRLAGRKRNMLFGLGRELVLPLDEPGLPTDVAKANEEAHAVLDRLEEVQREAREADEAATAAARIDEAAVRAAAVANQKPPPPTASIKRAEADEARSSANGWEYAARNAIWNLYNAIAENYDEWLAVRENAYATASERLASLLAEVAQAWPALETKGEELRIAREWHVNPTSAVVSLGGSRDTSRALSRARETIASHQRSNSPIPMSNPFELIAALERLAEERAA